MTSSILVIRAGALGDTILSLPALQALRDRYPHARLRVAGYPANWEVAGGLIDSVVSADSPVFAGLHADTATRELRAFLHDVDSVIAWTARDPRPALQAAGVRQVVGSPWAWRKPTLR